MQRLPGMIVCLLMVLAACSQESTHSSDRYLSGGPCEGCEAVLEFGDRILKAIDAMPGTEEGGLPLKITGTVYYPEGETPAADVVLYFSRLTMMDYIHHLKKPPAGPAGTVPTGSG